MALIKCNNLNMNLSRIILKSSSFKFRNTFLIRFYSTDTSLNELIKERNSRFGVKPSQMLSKPPFAKNLFLGVFDKDVLTYPELLSADQLKLLLDKLEPIEQYFTNEVKSYDIEHKRKISNEIINTLKNFKFFGLKIPKKYDGQGLNATEYARYCEVIGVDSSISLLLLAHQVLGVQSLLRYGSEEQKIKFLPKLASGDWYAAFCFSEEISGSDLAAIQTTAKESEKDGLRTWILNGSKLWVTNASSANIFIVLALTYSKNQFGDQKHVSAFIVERHYPGIIVGKPIDMIGVKGIEMNEVSFKNVQLTESNLLGDEKGGFKMAIDVLNSNRFAFGAVSLGFMKKLYKLVINHVINRKQYVIDLKDCKQIQKHCSEIALRIYALESMIYMTTGLHDCYENYDGSMENAIVKAFSMEEGQKCVDTCLDLLGARGVVEDESYEKFYRDFKCLSIFDGALDFTKLYIAATGEFDLMK
uniref:Uncharacterized protein n=1 Tax=Clastoptera arizonana TaxID=38151 RepID=A0A1B6CYZ8_9HEMI